MLALLLLLFAACLCRVIRVGAGFEFQPAALRAAIEAAVIGDTVELSEGEYVLDDDQSGVGLKLTRAITIRAGVGARSSPILRVANADRAGVVIGVGSGSVRLENFVIGRPLAGSPSSVEQVIGVLVSAGTQEHPSAYSMLPRYNGTHSEPLPLTGAIHAARELRKRSAPSGGEAPNRALTNIAIVGVDFTASASHTNLAFGAGAYVGVSITLSRFSGSSDSNSIVVAGGARFDSTTVERNIFGGSPAVINGVGFTFGSNYWSESLRAEQSTYCLDKSCTRFGPVVDGDHPTRVFGTVAEAIKASVQHVRITVQDVEWATSAQEASTVIAIADTTIEGVEITDCSAVNGKVGVANVNLRHRGSGGTILAYEGALSSVRNVQFTLQKDVGTAISIVQNRNAVTGGVPASTLLFERVTIYGHPGQTAIAISTSMTRVVLSELEIFDTSVGIELKNGALSISDSVMLVDAVGVKLLSGGKKHGLRIVDTLFFKAVGVSLADVTLSSMTELYIGCSRFLFASVRLPKDCMDNEQQCAAAFRHSTFIAAPDTLSSYERSILSRGSNHYEEEKSIEHADQYYMYTDDASRPQFSFALHDHQGRIDDASGVVTIGGGGSNTRWSFALATHIPMRQECFAPTISSTGRVNARVVSNLFDLRTDAPSACVSVALRVALRGSEVALMSGEDLSIYAVEHVGSAGATWTRAASHTVQVTNDGATTAVDASSGAGQLTRAVVVAARSSGVASAASALRYEAPVPTAPQAALAVTRATRQLCVVCGGDRIPATLIDEKCGGGSASPVFTDIDAAFEVLLAAKTSTISLFVYGDKCVTRQCSIELGVMAPNKLVVEGTSPTARGSIRRPASCAATTSFIKTGAGVTLRYLLIASASNVASAIPNCAIEAPARAVEGPRLAYVTISGGVCIAKGRTHTMLLNNDISVVAGRALMIDDGATGASLDSNTFSGGSVRVASSVDMTKNEFDADSWVDVVDGGQLVATSNVFAPRHADKMAPKPCVVATQHSKSQWDRMVFGEHCEIRLTGAAHQLSAGSWIGVRAYVAGASSVVGVALGRESFIQASLGVVLENVIVDLSATSVGDALRGQPVRQTNCAKQYEPGLGGYALARSSVYDQKSNKLFGPLVWPQPVGVYVDYATAAIIDCVNAPTADYCRCAVPGVQAKPDKQRAVAAEPKNASPLANDKPVQRKGAAAVGILTVAPTPAPTPCPPDDSSSDSDSPTPTSYTALYVILGVFGGLFCCLLIVVAILLSNKRRRRDDKDDRTSLSSGRGGEPEFDFGPSVRKNK